MIKNQKEFQRFEKELIRREKIDVARNFRLVDAMYEEAASLGIFPPKDALDGLKIDLKIAKVINSVSGTS